MFRTFPFAAALAACLPVAAFAADGIEAHDAYARASGPSAPTGAAFMVLYNTGDTDDRLVAARAPVAERVELHTHIADENGVMRMREIEGGIALPAGGRHVLARGGDHVMFLGLTAPLEQGAHVPLTLVFENAGEVVLDVVVDHDRAPGALGAHGEGMQHGKMGHGDMQGHGGHSGHGKAE
ncbi:copper-binding protein [Meridianimarinicoccus roseus]|uniref:Copper-binding protein n=1 Tax=Meridianimarinicoccus roseus TaxID=2072018 RepID=A0A2V2LCQ5_9RHOB|nr:copper chaperone PCu(A)C [Meridianimarinicoccus roseus]PWR01541.1 copper-binding protein [Meridianimarinicoccus roseus]